MIRVKDYIGDNIGESKMLKANIMANETLVQLKGEYPKEVIEKPFTLSHKDIGILFDINPDISNIELRNRLILLKADIDAL